MFKNLNLKTRNSSWKVFAILVVLMLLFSLAAQILTTNFYKIQCSDITIDINGYDRTFEIWRPVDIDPDTKLPCVVLSHGGSESLGCTSLYAWEFARRGYVVINENMDGAATSGTPNYDETGYTYGSYSRAGGAGHYDVLSYIRTIKYVDQTRIGFWGHSQGNGTMGASLRLGQMYYTLDDRCFNILYNDYGLTFTEEDLLKNPDDFAKAQLTEQQYGEYLVKKEAEAVTVSQYLKVARCAGANSKVTVAGIEVRRDAQMNMMPSVGSHESKGTWAPETLERYGATVRSEGTPTIMGIYSVEDTSKNPDAVGTYLGQIFEIDYQNNPEFVEAVENRQARFLNIPKTIHNGWLWGYEAVSTTIEYFCNCLGYNNGELSDPNTKPISGSDLSIGYTSLVFTTLSLFMMIGALIAAASILVKDPFFEKCAVQRAPAKMPLKGKDIWVWALVTTAVGFFGTWCCSLNDQSFSVSIATMNFFLPWEPAQIRMLFFVAGTAVAGAVMFFVLGKLKKKGEEGTLASLKEMNVKMNWRLVLKNLLLATILWGIAYAFAYIINMFFEQRFLHVDGGYELMNYVGFGRMPRYILLYAPFCLVISTLNNMVTIKGVKESTDTLINVVVTSMGMVLFMAIGFLVTYSSPGQAEIFRIHAMLSMIFLTPLCNYIYRKMYKVTGSVWAGAFLVAFIMAWRACGYISHRFMWIGNNEIAAFWGFQPF